jgi:hypothetical protein
MPSLGEILSPVKLNTMTTENMISTILGLCILQFVFHLYQLVYIQYKNQITDHFLNKYLDLELSLRRIAVQNISLR